MTITVTPWHLVCIVLGCLIGTIFYVFVLLIWRTKIAVRRYYRRLPPTDKFEQGVYEELREIERKHRPKEWFEDTLEALDKVRERRHRRIEEKEKEE